MAAPGISPNDLTVGQLVDIEARTWQFINKPGGTAKITHIHYNDDHVARSVDVIYSLGGRETNVELTYVKMYVEMTRNSRSRKIDVKMNVDTMGGQQRARSSEGKISSNAIGKEKTKKKGVGGEGGGSLKKKKKKERTALASIDRNQSQITGATRGAQVESLERASEAVGAKYTFLQQVGTSFTDTKKAIKQTDQNEEETGLKANKCDGNEIATSLKALTSSDRSNEANGQWELIKDGKTSDYVNILQTGQRISYWWSDEDGWFVGNIVNGLKKVVTATTIKWTIKVAFDSGDKHTLSFHPLDKRWKIFQPIIITSENPRKEVTKEQPASSTCTKKSDGKKRAASTKVPKSIGENSVASTKTAAATGDGKTFTSIKKPRGVDKDKQAGKSSSNSSTSKSSSTSKPKGYKQLSLSFGLQLQSQKVKEVSSNIHTPDSALVAKTAHVDVSELCLSTKSLGVRSSLLPPNTLTPDDAKYVSQQNQSSAFAPSNMGGQLVGSLGKEKSLDTFVASRNNVVDMSIGERGDSKLSSEKASRQDKEQKDSQAESDRDEITTKRKANSSTNQNASKKLKDENVQKLAEVVEADGKWELIQDGKITHYTNILQNGQRISYWWSEVDGWLKGTISKGLKRVVTTSTIKWTIAVVFDNGEKHTLLFHPHDKRWKVFHPKKVLSSLVTDRPNKQTVSEEVNSASLGMTKHVEGNDVLRTDSSNAETNAHGKLANVDKKLESSTSKPKGYKQLPLSFGLQLQSKVQEVASKILSSSTTDKVGHETTADSCSLAVEKGLKKSYRDIQEKTEARTHTSQSSASSPSSKRTNLSTSRNSIKSSASLTASGQTVLKTLYKKECEKANEFVGYMTAPTEINSNRAVEAASSPGTLELIWDQKREDQFNSLLSEIMYKERLDMMNVDEMVERMNKRHKSCRPFSLLEVKPFLQKLHKDNRIFLVEEEGKHGVVYAI